jgi:dipeptidyl aminopeptidase/acylaminoacyl peptidase
VLVLAAAIMMAGRASGEVPLSQTLKTLPFKIAYESYVEGNWDIYVADADGSGVVNLTHSPNEQEHYPQISPDGKRMCYLSDTGEGRETVRTLYLMDIDGKKKVKIAEHVREPFWRHDGKVIGYLPQLYPKFSPTDGYSDGMMFYDLESQKSTPHVNSAKLHQLYNPSFSPNGKWIAATVHAGMDIGHAIILVEANGSKIVKLDIPGCRPCLSPDNKQIAWGPDDHILAVAPLDLDSDNPAVGPWRLRIKDEKNKVYHIDWSPDGRFLAFSRGPDGGGEPKKAGTYQAACEMIGVYANGWDIYAVSAEKSGILDVQKAGAGELARITSNGQSNKEPAWIGQRPGK